jgi:predicted DsbA family dithiol-disulfide isomerase
MHDLLFVRLHEVWNTSEGNLIALMTRYADELGLDVDAFSACIEAGEALAQVQALDAEQRARGITLQPTFEINDVRLVGLQPYARFQELFVQMTAE